MHYACIAGRTEVVQLLISSSKKFSINLNARINPWFGSTALHLACENDRGETVQLMMRHWKEFGIDIKARDNAGKTPLDITKERIRIFGTRKNLKKMKEMKEMAEMMENEYFKMDVTDNVD